ncbi:regulatory iron-sulfur-containing complex subunit RicT [Bacteriovorax sp. DB6_IX]|uniref:PSP1 domain-containing protein n=1 Tax=Bacteriovorax sp. DB6_IX TaxID=1353530 RepID=UPI00038A12FA|nr:regulatory iron-sulfur-containing complex subunit RicT [Bacteriovorax sp. DB6_IX]EQC49820.1 PSP1 C-terminal domain protein [Bacteriovorax sp. DB6_IX]
MSESSQNIETENSVKHNTVQERESSKGSDSQTKHKKKVQKQDEKLIKEQESRFSEGEELTFVRVRFPGNAKSQPFLLGSRHFIYGQKVIAMSDRGMTVGYVNSFPYTVPFDKSMLPIRTISKVATDEDIEEQKSFLKKENEAEVLCLRLIEKHNLNMNLTHVEFIQFGKKAVFYFTAPERVDFRGLVKDLVSDLKMRIELRQISVRDRAAALGATGACGLQTCCSSFLSNYGNSSIKMAKNQNLALIPSKINGVCGQVKCCMKYEDDVYTQKRKFLPPEYTYIRVKNGDIGKVIKLHLLIEQFELLTDKGQIRRYAKNQYHPKKCNPPSGWKFPTEFRSIISETSTVIGLSELEEEMLDRYSHTIDTDDELGVEIEVDNDGTKQDDEEIERIPLDSEESSDENQPQKNNKRNNQRSQSGRNNNRNNRSSNRNNKNNRNNRNNQNRNGNKDQSKEGNNVEAKNSDGPNNRRSGGNSKNYRRNNNKRPNQDSSQTKKESKTE